MKYQKTVLLLSLCLSWTVAVGFIVASAQAQTGPGNCSHPQEPRCVVLISDLHFGVGKDSTGNWDPTEDFRWGEELNSFLDTISLWGGNKVDLVIAGDLL